MTPRKRATAISVPTFDHWWQKSPFFDLTRGHSTQKPGAKPAYILWESKDFAAWTYEIVRRLPYFKGIKNEILAPDFDALLMLPPFPQLTLRQQTCLLQAFTKRPPIRVVQSRFAVPQDKYTAPLPPISFDRLAMTKRAILEYFAAWIDVEDTRLGISFPPGRKGGRSRNRDQKSRVADWRLVELAEPRHEGEAGFDKAKQARRRRAKKYGLRYYKVVLLARLLAQTTIPIAPLTPILPGLVGKPISVGRLESALKKVLKKASGRSGR